MTGRNDDDNIDIPGFMNRPSSSRREIQSVPLAQGRSQSSRASRSRPYSDRLEADMRNCKRQSVGGEQIRAKRSTRQVPKSSYQRLREKFSSSLILGATLLIGISLGVGASQVGQNYVAEMNMQNLPEVAEINQVVNDNVHRTDNGEGYFYDTLQIAEEARDHIENGDSPTVVLGSIAKKLNEDYAQDDLDNIVNRIFDVQCGADEFVRQINPDRYQDGIHGENFMNDYRDALQAMTYSENAEASDRQMRNVYDANHNQNQELSDMMSEYSNAQTTSQEKGMGGK